MPTEIGIARALGYQIPTELCLYYYATVDDTHGSKHKCEALRAGTRDT